jgi:hypothetical protein
VRGDEQAWADELARLRVAHAQHLEAKEQRHTYEQADDLLTACQNDRAETEKKHQASMSRLQEELATTKHNLAVHQVLYADYSERIQLELQELKDEIQAAQQTIHQQDERATQQDALIDSLQREAGAQVVERQLWERELIQQSNGVLLLKQESFELERSECEKVVVTLRTTGLDHPRTSRLREAVCGS